MKIGIDISDLNFVQGVSFFEIETSSLVILSTESFDLFITHCHLYKRDFDILEEHLGISIYNFCVYISI